MQQFKSGYLALMQYLANWADLYRGICSNCDRLGFYAEMHIMFGTVHAITMYLTNQNLVVGRSLQQYTVNSYYHPLGNSALLEENQDKL